MAFWTRSLLLLALIAVLAPIASHAVYRQYLCGNQLMETLVHVCREYMSVESTRQGRRNIEESQVNEVEELSFQPRDMKKRGITEKCCVDGCSIKELQRYCLS